MVELGEFILKRPHDILNARSFILPAAHRALHQRVHRHQFFVIHRHTRVLILLQYGRPLCAAQQVERDLRRASKHHHSNPPLPASPSPDSWIFLSDSITMAMRLGGQPSLPNNDWLGVPLMLLPSLSSLHSSAETQAANVMRQLQIPTGLSRHCRTLPLIILHASSLAKLPTLSPIMSWS